LELLVIGIVENLAAREAYIAATSTPPALIAPQQEA
jgi:hypothetical protein